MCMKYAGCPILLWCQVKHLIGLEVSHTKSLSLGSANIPPALAEPAAWEPNLASPQPPAAPITGRFWQATLRPPQVGDQR